LTESRLAAAVSAGVMASDESQRALLESIVEVARAIFGARASSILLLEEEPGELVFEAVAGEGAGTIIGRRMPADEGIAGWVLQAREPLVLEDVTGDPRFARDVAESTGYVPKGIMAAPLLSDEAALGVLSVLDRPQRSRFSLAELELLGLFASQAAIALDIVQRTRRAKAALAGEQDMNTNALARLAAAVDALDGSRRPAALRLLDALTEVLEAG
jgi:GAF domain-containing protein